MKNVKQQFHDYMSVQESTQHIDQQFKQELRRTLLKPTSFYRRMWFFPSMAIAGAAVIAIITFKPFASDNVSTALTTALVPHEALAEVITQAVNPDLLYKTLGLPDDDAIHYRQVVFEYNYAYPNEAELGSGINSIDIWSGPQAVRADATRESLTPTAQTLQHSFLLNQTADQYCDDNIETRCYSIADVQQQNIQSLLGEHGSFSTPTDPELIDHVTTETFTDDTGYPGIYYRWSTSTKMKYPSMSTYNTVTQNGQGGSAEFVEERDGLYWYEFKQFYSAELNQSELILQVTDAKSASPVDRDTIVAASSLYTYNPDTEYIEPISTDELAQSAAENVLKNDILPKSGYSQVVEPLLYVLRHQELLESATTTDGVTFHDTQVNSASYTLPIDYLYQTSFMLGAALDHEDRYTMTLYVDADTNTFAGYQIVLDGNVVIDAQFLNPFISSDEANALFAPEEWMDTHME